MAITLNPTVASLGIMAPVLGPWFSNTSVSLPALATGSDGTLGLSVTLPPGTDWLPPATGLLSLYVTTGPSRPPALDALQDAGGEFPFPEDRIVAYFRLLPEVEARLHALIGALPAVTANPITALPTSIGTPTRPQVRSLALVLPAGTALTPDGLKPFLPGTVPGDTDEEQMAAVGLALSGGQLANGAVPMTRLRRPGGSAAQRDVLLSVPSGGEIQLWAFDRRGRAIDPGAVASWWSWLLGQAIGEADSALQLAAPGLAAGDYPQDDDGKPVVVPVAAQRTVHLVDAHEGPLGAPFLNGRLQVGSSAATSALVQATGTESIALTFQPVPTPSDPPPPDNPAVDDAPRPRLAVLPNGSYGASATLWPGGPVHAGLARDFVRVGVVDEERHLVGVARRDSRAAATTAAERRESAQNRPSTRINVARTAGTEPVLLANAQAAADALLALPGASGTTRLVLGIGDALWGGAQAAFTITPGTGELPAGLADAGDATPGTGQYRVRALTGGGELAEDHQWVLVEVALGAAGAGAWVRAWPQGFDLRNGVHFSLTGGAGRANGSGLAVLVMVLPNGKVDSAGLLGMELGVLRRDATGAVTARRHYQDCRFSRPAPLGGPPATAIAGNWVVCETGVAGSGSLPAGAVPPGGHVVLMSDPPALVERTALPAAALAANTLRNRLQSTDIVSLTTPAFGSTPNRADAVGRPLPRDPAGEGDARGGIDAVVGGRLHLLDRNLLADATASSVPYALLDRLEVAGANPGASGGPVAAIGAAPPVPWALEPDSLFFGGHPGVPASIETHGTGVALSGPPALAVAEYVRERTAGLSFAEVQGLSEPARSAAVQSELAVAAEAVTPLPSATEGSDPGPVVAVLRTCAAGLEGLPVVGALAGKSSIFPLSQHEADFETLLDAQISAAGGAGTALRGAIGDRTDAITRALDRRLMTAAFGATEGLTALLSAIGRAQDLVYLETPAVDKLAIDPSGENRGLWQALIDRMQARPGLRVVLCVPSLLAAGSPQRLQDVRDHCLHEALEAMRAVAADRFAVFSPGADAGRAVRFAATSVIVDDVFALTGTTHLWRRGLTWDSSLAAAVFDERLVDGRPQEVRAFRIRLLADRLGLPVGRLPEDPAELVAAIQALDKRGSDRLSAVAINRPESEPSDTDIDTWNPDGTRTDLNLASVAALFAAAVALTDTEHAIVEG